MKLFKKGSWTKWGEEVEYYYIYFLKEFIYCPMYRFFTNYVHLRWFKWMWQRVFRGFSDRQLWSLDYTVAKYTLPKLKHYRNNCLKHGVPGVLCAEENDIDIDYEVAREEWKRIIDTMIYSLEHVIDDDFDPCFTHDEDHGIKIVGDVPGERQVEAFGIHMDEVKFKERELKIQEGFANFGKYFRNLWW